MQVTLVVKLGRLDRASLIHDWLIYWTRNEGPIGITPMKASQAQL
jgi:hypothetical protein